jgi:hypothetical protein
MPRKKANILWQGGGERDMIFVDQFPAALKSFFLTIGVEVSAPQQVWLVKTMLAMAVACGRRNVKTLFALLDPEESVRSTLNDFFTQSPWAAPAVLRSGTLHVLELMKLQPGEEIQIILDGSQKAKRGEHMEALGWVKEAGSKEWRKGHRYLLCYLRVRGWCLPWAIDLYLSKKYLRTEAGKELRQRRPELHFRTLNEMSADMLATFPEDWAKRFQVNVLLDSGFCNSTVCDAVLAQGFQYIVAAQSSRALEVKETTQACGRHVYLKTYAPGRLRYQGQEVLLPPKRPGARKRRFRVAAVRGALRGLGEVTVVFSQRRSDNHVLCLVASDPTADARQVALDYGWRWEIEVTIKGLKQCLGLGQYQCRYYEGMVHHLHLSLLAHLLLCVAGQTVGTNKTLKRAAHSVPSTRELQAQLRLVLWEQIIDDLKSPSDFHRFKSRLKSALGAA